MFADVTDSSGWEIHSRNEAPTRNGELKTKSAYLPGGMSSFQYLLQSIKLLQQNLDFSKFLTGGLVSVPVLYSLALTPFSLQYH